MRQYPGGAPVRVRTDGLDRPLAFTWEGETHRVDSIEDIREPRLDWWAPTGEVHRVYYLVTSHRGLICELYHDRVAGGWAIARVFD